MTSMPHIPNHGAPDDQLATRLPIPMAKRIEPRRIRKPRNKTLEAFLGAAIGKPSTPSITELNQQTGCPEYYGRTSNLTLATSINKRLGQLDNNGLATLPQPRDESLSVNPISRTSVGLANPERLVEVCDYVVPLTASNRRYRTLQRDVADRHIESFLTTIHIYFPVFDMSSFRAKYARLRELFSSNRRFGNHNDDQVQQQSFCLLYAVLALGALYSSDVEDSSSWAAWYFSEAQEIIGRLFDAVNLELVQAAMFMGAYAQHVIKPNLAYNLIGLATRMAFSIGLNVAGQGQSPSETYLDEAKRTWCMVYVQEVELSLDSGRPMSLRSCDANVAFLSQNIEDDAALLGDLATSKTVFIKYLTGIAQITRDIMTFLDGSKTTITTPPLKWDRIDSFDTQLLQWRESLPSYLRFRDYLTDQNYSPETLSSWTSRQQSSLRVHYNMAVMILHRTSLQEAERTTRDKVSIASEAKGEQAASDMIRHIYSSFKAVPDLRKWTYYCFYCLQATLTLLIKLVDEPLLESNLSMAELCELSIDVFQQIDLRSADQCAKMLNRKDMPVQNPWSLCPVHLELPILFQLNLKAGIITKIRPL
ncbi:hypothetical protein VF21_00341 [Pseudogymnoascus sp. 05NY08]|nr:hypothetical protein VF21_00341 [Pseudogymnoascus sp. 05NY08]